MPEAKAISVVIPTYNRRERLCRVLRALDEQTTDLDEFEGVVVDDGSTDGTAEALAALRPRFALRVLRQENGGPARARNAGVEAARGRFILFLDDDVVPAPDLVAEHLRSQAAEQRVVVMGPLASLAHYRQPWVAWEQAKLEAQYAAMARRDWAPTFRQFWTGNASVAREHLQEAGGFNPEFKRAEDVELGRRLHDQGLGFRFNPRARGLHHAERSLDSWMNAHASYGALEVRIFGALGGGEAQGVLAANWSRLHPVTRRLVLGTVARPRRFARATAILRRWLLAEEALPRTIAAGQVCSALANLLYWNASAEAMGLERARAVFRRGDAIRRARF